MTVEEKLVNGAGLKVAYDILLDRIENATTPKIDLPLQKGVGINSVQTPLSKANADYSQAFGDNCVINSSGVYSHAEGDRTCADGYNSHAEGCVTYATGEYSHAEGLCTVASSECQHVSGAYNIEDSEDMYVEIIGNGTYNKRSNARTLDWNGNETLKGKIVADGVNINDLLITEGPLKTSWVDTFINSQGDESDSVMFATTEGVIKTRQFYVSILSYSGIGFITYYDDNGGFLSQEDLEFSKQKIIPPEKNIKISIRTYSPTGDKPNMDDLIEITTKNCNFIWNDEIASVAETITYLNIQQ